MKLKLKENMYVRTKDGYISQYKYYDYDIGEGLIGKLLCIPLSNGTFANIENIKKFSYNIIDILEKGDYVNGYIVEEIKRGYDGKIWIDNSTRGYDEGGEYTIWKRNEDIKSVITHEQMEQMAYKVSE